MIYHSVLLRGHQLDEHIKENKIPEYNILFDEGKARL